MSAKTTINQPIILADVQIYDWDRYTLQVDGSASGGRRRMTVTVPIVDSDGVRVSQATVTLEQDDFNEFWSAFNSDKQIANLVLESKGISASTADIPDNIVNQKSRGG